MLDRKKHLTFHESWKFDALIVLEQIECDASTHLSSDISQTNTGMQMPEKTPVKPPRILVAYK